MYSLFSDSGDLWTADLDTGESVSLQLSDETSSNSSDGFGQPVAMGERLYVPVLVRTTPSASENDDGSCTSVGGDRLAHQVLVVNSDTNRIERSIDLSFAVPCDNRFELFEEGGRLWFNDLEGKMAGVLSAAGPTLVVDKVEQTTISGVNAGDDAPGAGSVNVIEVPDSIDNATGWTTRPGGTGNAGTAQGSSPAVDSNDAGTDPRTGEGTGQAPGGDTGSETPPTAASGVGNEPSTATPPPAASDAGSTPPVTTPGVITPTPATTIPATVGPVAAGPGPEKKPAATPVSQPAITESITANFTYSPPGEPTTETLMTFFDASSGTIDQWRWTFTSPGGSTSTANGRTVTRTLPAVGLWTVSLTVSNAAGRVDSTRPVALQVRNAEDLLPPNANFSWDPQTPTVRQAVQFKDRSTTGKNTPLTSWFWEFGDGTTSNAQNPPAKTYAQPGTYVVRLTVRNGAGTASANSVLTVAQPPAPLRPEFTYATAGKDPSVIVSGQPVVFTDATLGGPTAWVWDFGDGSTAITPTASHVFRSVGAVSVTLRVSNATDAKSLTKSLRVDPPPTPPQARISEPEPSTKIELGKELRFVSGSTGGATKLLWTWGDGTSSEGATATKIFTSIGPTEVTLTASNAAGSSTAKVLVQVVAVPSLPPLVPGFRTTVGTSPTDLAVVGEPVRFVNTSTGTGTFLWNFGDGSTSTERDPSYRFKKTGTFHVTLTMSGDGRSAVAAGDVYVGPAPVAVVANFDYTPKNPTVAQPVTFVDQTTGTPTRWTWSFGDGSPAFTGQKPPPKTYPTAGKYEAALTVADRNGAITVKKLTITVKDAPLPQPDAVFNVTPTNAADWVVGKALLFTDATPSATVSPLTTPVFTFDGVPVSPPAGSRSVEHIFTTAGRHAVSMKVCWVDDPTNCKSADQALDIKLPVNKPAASFILTRGDVLSGTEPPQPSQRTVLLVGPVTFDDTSTGGDTRSWSIQGKTYTSKTVDLATLDPGDLTVTLTVSNSAGQTEITRQFLVVATQPKAAFDLPADPVANVALAFADASTGVPAVAIRTWTFGDGTQGEGNAAGATHTYSVAKTYEVTLTIDLYGFTSVFKKSVVVKPLPLPTPAIEARNTTTTEVSTKASIDVALGDTVQFVDVSTGVGTTGRLWTWNPATTPATTPTIERTFNVAGEFTLTLESTNASGTATIQMVVRVSPPTTQANSTSGTPTIGLPVGPLPGT